MGSVEEILNEDYLYQSYVVDFAFHNIRFGCDGLKNYLTKRF